jgi:hypothetical protein
MGCIYSADGGYKILIPNFKGENYWKVEAIVRYY